METKVMYVDFDERTLTKVEEITQLVRAPRKKIRDYQMGDYIQEIKLMTNRCVEMVEEFLYL